SKLLYVVIEDLDADRAALLSNEVAQAYIAENLALKMRNTETATQWLEERLKDLQEQMQKGELAGYGVKKRAEMRTTSLEDRQSMVSQRLNTINLALTEVRTKVARLKARADTLSKFGKLTRDDDEHWEEGFSAAEDNPLVQQLKVRYATQKAECAELQE